MSTNYEQVKRSTIDFAARFGFVTREIFFDYLCPLKKSRKYSFWSDLQRDGTMAPSRSAERVCYLTKSARMAARRRAAPARSIFFVEHDATVAKLYLELERSGLVVRSWTDQELAKNPWDTCGILGSDRMEKVPDLIVDMKSKTGAMRFAFEIERSRKSNVRYDQMALHYLGFKNVSLVLFCCNSAATAKAVDRAFNASVFRKAEKTPAVFLTESFEKSKMAAPAEFLGSKIELKQLILAALQQPESNWQNAVEKFWKPFHENSADQKECA